MRANTIRSAHPRRFISDYLRAGNQNTPAIVRSVGSMYYGIEREKRSISIIAEKHVSGMKLCLNGMLDSQRLAISSPRSPGGDSGLVCFCGLSD